VTASRHCHEVAANLTFNDFVFGVCSYNLGNLSASDLDLEPIGGRHSAIPQSRVLNPAFLVSVVHVGQPVTFGVAIRPLKIVEEAPSVK
jgi:hypothetical protein